MISITPEFIDQTTENRCLNLIEELWDETPHGVGTGNNRSRIMRFGYDYLTPNWLRDIPGWLFDLSDRVGKFDSITINEYKPGDKIEPHIDSPAFDDFIAILSLGADCVMTFTKDGYQNVKGQFLPRRSLLKFSGEERTKWKHSIPPLLGKNTRISIVFRKRVKVSEWKSVAVTSNRRNAALCDPAQIIYEPRRIRRRP